MKPLSDSLRDKLNQRVKEICELVDEEINFFGLVVENSEHKLRLQINETQQSFY